MSNSVEITWLGHACFKLECGGYSIVIDPYKDDTVPGLPQLRVTADAVFCSHDHDDHNGTDCVAIKPAGVEYPFEELVFTTPHDDEGGLKRGMSKVRVFTAGELRIAHMGDIGRELTNVETLLLQGVDALLIPVGGYYTIDAKQAKAMVDAVKPKVTIPMHFRGEGFGYPVIGPVEEFTRLFDEVCYGGSSFTLTSETPEQILVMSF